MMFLCWWSPLFHVTLENFPPYFIIVQLLTCCSPHQIIQEMTIQHFVAISLKLGGILTRLLAHFANDHVHCAVGSRLNDYSTVLILSEIADIWPDLLEDPTVHMSKTISGQPLVQCWQHLIHIHVNSVVNMPSFVQLIRCLTTPMTKLTVHSYKRYKIN